MIITPTPKINLPVDLYISPVIVPAATEFKTVSSCSVTLDSI